MSNAEPDKSLIRTQTFYQLIRFCLVGFVNTGMDFVFYLFFTRIAHFHLLFANFLAFLLSATNSYFMNKYFTFQEKERANISQYGKFVIMATGALGLSELVLWTSVHVFGWHDLFGKIVGVGAMLVWNFLFSKFFIFHK